MLQSSLDRITDAEVWKLDANGGFILGQHDSQRRFIRQSISCAETKSVHPDLPAIVHALFDWNKKNAYHIRDDDYVKNEKVLATLALISNTVIRIFQKKGNVALFYDIHDVLLKPDKMGDIHVKGRLLRLDRSIDYLDGRDFVCDVVDTSVWFPKQILDRQFPGWNMQWAVGRELGLDPAELSRTVFAKRDIVEETPSLAGLNFD